MSKREMLVAGCADAKAALVLERMMRETLATTSTGFPVWASLEAARPLKVDLAKDTVY